jgi:MFS family permease
VVIASSIGLAAAASLRAIASDPWMLWVTAALGGVSLGAFYAVDLAAAMRLVARRSAGRALGLFNLAETLPQIATPILAGSLLSAGSPDPIGGDAGFTLLFGVAAGLSLIAAALVPALSPTLRRSSPDGVTPGRGGDLR